MKSLEYLSLSFDAISPIFFLIFLGWLLRKWGLGDERTFRQMNNMVFRLFLPVMMLMNIYKSHTADFRPRLVCFVAASVSALFLLLFVVIPRIEKENSRRGVLIQGMARSNFAVFGYAIAAKLGGPDCLGLTALMVAVVLPLYGVYSTIALEMYGATSQGRAAGRAVGKKVLANPLVLGGAGGLLLLFSGLRLPGILEEGLGNVAQMALPLSLIVLGGFLDRGMLEGRRRQMVIGLLGKLVVAPALFVALAVAWGFRDGELAVILAVFASPPATASFAMVQQMSGDENLAGGLVVLGCVFSSLTVFIFIFLLKHWMLL